MHWDCCSLRSFSCSFSSILKSRHMSTKQQHFQLGSEQLLPIGKRSRFYVSKSDEKKKEGNDLVFPLTRSNIALHSSSLCCFR